MALARSVRIVAPGEHGQLDILPLGYLESFYEQIQRYNSSLSSEVNKILQSPARQFLISRLRQRTGKENLSRLLVTYKDSQCAEIRDKIFALVSLSDTAKLHLGVDYTADPVTILFSVLRFAFSHESLHYGGIVGLMYQLKRQLGLSREDLLQSFGRHQDITPQLALIAAYHRGYVTHDIVDPRLEACAQSCQNFVVVLRTLRTPSLRIDERSGSINALKFTGTPQGLLNKTFVSGQDLRVFAFTQKGFIDSTKVYTYVALATSWVELGDEVWQSLNTPVALIARREVEAYRIVARALIIKGDIEHLTEAESRHNWSKFLCQGSYLLGSQTRSYEEKPLVVSFGGLLDILEWTDADDSSPL